MVLPGLGHILTGKLTTGFGLLLIMAIIAWAAVAGLPTLDQVIWLWSNGLVRPEPRPLYSSSSPLDS